MLHRESFGQNKITLVDRFGVFLSLLAINKFLPRAESIKILELGCGYNATLLQRLQKRITHGIGVDFQINPNLYAIPKLTFMESSIEEAIEELSAVSLDAIMIISVLEHLSDPKHVLQQCYQLLHKNGVLLINVPTWRGKAFLEFSAFKLGTSPKLEMDDHKMYYDKKDLWPLLIQAGFKPSKVNLRYHKFGLNLFAVAQK